MSHSKNLGQKAKEDDDIDDKISATEHDVSTMVKCMSYFMMGQITAEKNFFAQPQKVLPKNIIEEMKLNVPGEKKKEWLPKGRNTVGFFATRQREKINETCSFYDAIIKGQKFQDHQPDFNKGKTFQNGESRHLNRFEPIIPMEVDSGNSNSNSSPAKLFSHAEKSNSRQINERATIIPRVESAFRTAHEQLSINDKKQGVKRAFPSQTQGSVHVSGLRKGARLGNSFNPPGGNQSKEPEPVSEDPIVCEMMEHESMKNVDVKMVEAIMNEVMEVAKTNWSDIAGLEKPKDIIREVIIWPMIRPDIFFGLRSAPKGILLFGPPGTGKTMIGRLIATESNSTFFNISASSLTSKWIGDGEKMVRALFAVARLKQPAVIFIDEIDSILTARSGTEHESSRRLKTEFLIQFDGCGSNKEDKILVIGVTNRPQELDEAARRRLVKKVYIPLPDQIGRMQLVKNLMKGQTCSLSEEDFGNISESTDGFSGADMASLCREAAYGPIRDLSHSHNIESINASQVRPMTFADFESALKIVKASVAPADLIIYEDWDRQFGSTS